MSIYRFADDTIMMAHKLDHDRRQMESYTGIPKDCAGAHKSINRGGGEYSSELVYKYCVESHLALFTKDVMEILLILLMFPSFKLFCR